MLSVQVDVTGPDAKAIKATYAAFHSFKNGRTTLSCSGLALLPPPPPGGPSPDSDTWWVLAPLSSIYPFLQQPHRTRLAAVTQLSLLPGASITIQLRTTSGELTSAPATLAAVLPLPAARAAAEQLLQSTNSASPGSWRLGWLLADQQPQGAATASLLAHVAVLQVNSHIAGTTAAAAGACVQQQQQCSCGGSGLRPGLAVAVTGSPFGCLAPEQFHGAVVTGVISNLLQSRLPGQPASVGSSTPGSPGAGAAAAMDAALFVVDARVMPGMEGGAIWCRCCGRLLGQLGVPLTNSSSRVELMVGLSAAHIQAAAAAAAAAAEEGGAEERAAAGPAPVTQVAELLRAVLPPAASNCSGDDDSGSSSLRRQPVLCLQPGQQDGVQQLEPWQPQGQAETGGLCQHSAAAAPASAAAAAAQLGVVMVRVGRSWGSGVIMTSSGLIMTNAHLFGASTQGSNSSSSSAVQPLLPSASIRISLPDGSSSSSWLPTRLLHCFQGYLDLALLQILPSSLQQLSPAWQLLPLQLCELGADVTPGADVLVAGHGLFGPLVGLPPAVTAGCAARVVALPAAQQGPTAAAAAGHAAATVTAGSTAASPDQAGASKRNTARAGVVTDSREISPGHPPHALHHHHASQLQQQQQGRPSMVISTAAVHAGASGGALLDRRCRLVGLVTSNARHARGATLPHCNFCISAAELRPVWWWAQQQHQLWQQQQQQHTAGQCVTGAVGEAALQQLRQLDCRDETGTRLWALLPAAASNQQRRQQAAAAAELGSGCTAAAAAVVSKAAPQQGGTISSKL